MSACIALRDDYDSLALRNLARRSRDPRQVRRLLALAAAYDGMSRTEAAKVCGMDRQTLRDWAHRFNDEGPDGLKHRSGSVRGASNGDPYRDPMEEMRTHLAIERAGMETLRLRVRAPVPYPTQSYFRSNISLRRLPKPLPANAATNHSQPCRLAELTPPKKAPMLHPNAIRAP